MVVFCLCIPSCLTAFHCLSKAMGKQYMLIIMVVEQNDVLSLFLQQRDEVSRSACIISCLFFCSKEMKSISISQLLLLSISCCVPIQQEQWACFQRYCWVGLLMVELQLLVEMGKGLIGSTVSFCVAMLHSFSRPDCFTSSMV